MSAGVSGHDRIGCMKRSKLNAVCATLAALLLAGCATGTQGVVPAGNGLYLIGGLGNFTEYSGSQVKARYLAEATKYCADRKKDMVLVNSTSRDSGFGTYASAEIQFRCSP